LCKKTGQLSVKDEGILDLLRTFVDDMGKSLSEIIKPSKDVFNNYIKNVILKNCKERYPDFISKFEYSGNLYDNLITEGQDDDDVLVLVILKKKSNDVAPVLHQGYGEFKVQGPKYGLFSNDEKHVCPDKVRKWFFKIVREEAEKCEREYGLTIKISQPNENSRMKLDIKFDEPSSPENQLCLQAASDVGATKSSLTVNLVPAFEVEGKFFVPLKPINLLDSPNTNSKWRQSFPMEVKAILQDMDKDSGCRHDLYKVVNTILKREATFSNLLPHMKMLFVVFIKDSMKEWDKSKLGDKFEEYFNFLANLLKKKKLKHFWLKDVNLLSNIPDITLENMEKRLTRILNSDQERRKMLTY
jgi:hypothetical protein